VFTVRLDAIPAESGPLTGLDVSVKDNIDVAGVVTTAGSRAYLNNAPARTDASVVARLRHAGARVFAKTNMTEFAYSTLGFNAYFGTPANPWRPDGEDRIPGGSSSGAAVSLALGLGDVAIGTDTAGSSRIPAALCGVVGFRPRSRAISRTGIVPLSPSHDAVGILGREVSRITQVFEVLAEASSLPAGATGEVTSPIRLLLPADEHADPDVQLVFSRAVDGLAELGIEVISRPVPFLREVRDALANGGLTAYEALAFHETILKTSEALYEPYTLGRLENARRGTRARYLELLAERDRLRQVCVSEFEGCTAILMPTSPILAPRISDLQTEASQRACGLRLMANTAIANALDLPSISIPCHRPNEGPVGLMLTGTGSEQELLALAEVVEQGIAASRVIRSPSA